MSNYYFLAPSLPPLIWGVRPELTFDALKVRLRENLSSKDWTLIEKMLLLVDICNIRYLLMEEPIDSRGGLSEKELDEALLIRDLLPSYVFEFLDQFEKTTDRIRHFSGLIARFFNEEIPQAQGFLRRFFTFEREWRLVLVGLRAKQMGRDVVRELQFEDPADPLVASILAQKDGDRYDPPEAYQELKELMNSSYPDPLEEQKAFMAYRLKKIEEMEEAGSFSMDAILSYTARLMIIEQYEALDEEVGRRILEGIPQRELLRKEHMDE